MKDAGIVVVLASLNSKIFGRTSPANFRVRAQRKTAVESLFGFSNLFNLMYRNKADNLHHHHRVEASDIIFQFETKLIEIGANGQTANPTNNSCSDQSDIDMDQT